MPIGRRAGRPGLIGTAARTAVIAGTAQATAGAVANRQQQKYAAQQAAQQPPAAPPVQQAPPAPPVQASPPAPAPQAPAGPGADLIAQLQQLGQLHSSGILNDTEFAQAKAKLLG